MIWWWVAYNAFPNPIDRFKGVSLLLRGGESKGEGKVGRERGRDGQEKIEGMNLLQTGSYDVSIHPQHLSILSTVMFHPRFQHDIQTTAVVFYLASSGLECDTVAVTAVFPRLPR